MGRLNELLGANPVVIDVHALFWSDPPEYVTSSTVPAVSITRGRSDIAQPADAGTMSLAMAATVRPPGIVGSMVRLRLTDEAIAVLYPAGDARAEKVRWRFTGYWTDLEQDIDTQHQRINVTADAASMLSRLARTKIGHAPWPTGTTDMQIIRDVLTACWTNDYRCHADAWLNSPTMWWQPMNARQPSPNTFFPWDVDAQPALDVINDVAEDVNGLLVEHGNGQLDWITPESRQAAPISATIPADIIMSPLPSRQDGDGLVTAASVVYGDPDLLQMITVSDLQARGVVGTYETTISTRLLDAEQATRRGWDVVGRQAWPNWTLTQLGVDLIHAWHAGYQAEVRDLLALQGGELIALQGIPTTAPPIGWMFWVEGIAEDLDDASWVLTLTLAAFPTEAPPVRWGDLPDDLTWADLQDGFPYSWSYSTAWQPDPFPTGSWRNTPTNQQWSDAGTTQWQDRK